MSVTGQILRYIERITPNLTSDKTHTSVTFVDKNYGYDDTI